METYNQWESVSADTTTGLTTLRLKTPSGWLVYVYKTSGGAVVGLVEVGDPDHTWTLAATSSEDT